MLTYQFGTNHRSTPYLCFWDDIFQIISDYLIKSENEQRKELIRDFKDNILQTAKIDHHGDMQYLKQITETLCQKLHSSFSSTVSPWLGEWTTNCLSYAVGGGGSTLKYQLETVLKKYVTEIPSLLETQTTENNLDRKLEAARQEAEYWQQQLNQFATHKKITPR